jgi:hypothetical protein
VHLSGPRTSGGRAGVEKVSRADHVERESHTHHEHAMLRILECGGSGVSAFLCRREIMLMSILVFILVARPKDSNAGTR